MELEFTQELDRIIGEVLKMGHNAEEYLDDSVQALRTKDELAAKELLDRDVVIDTSLIVIEDSIVRLAGMQRLLPKDARTCLGIVNIANALERIGDYATNIAEIVLDLKDEEYIKPLVHIPQLADVAVSMLHTALKAFINQDVDLAEAVCRKDEEADDLLSEIDHELIHLVGQGVDSGQARQAALLLGVAQYLERVADLATNICEETIYMVTGNRVKY